MVLAAYGRDVAVRLGTCAVDDGVRHCPAVTPHETMVERSPTRRSSDRAVLWLAVAGSAAVAAANVSGIAMGDDGVGYRATADSLLNGGGLRYFLESPLTVWPPLWPALMSLVSEVTSIDTPGAAVVLNVLCTFVVVMLSQRVMRRVLRDDRLVLLGTAVVALGSSTIGFGHLLMTDFAFGAVVMGLVLVLLRFGDDRRIGRLVAAGAIVWLGFLLRYVALYLIPVVGLWLILLPAVGTARRASGRRILDAAVFVAVAAIGPTAWMLRNHSLDGTFTGARYPSDRGPIANAYDIAATIGRFLLPGVADDRDRVWATVGLLVVAVALVLGVRVLLSTRRQDESTTTRVLRLGGSPIGLLIGLGVGYLAYMLSVRSTTALNRLDLRLLEPAYLPLMVCGLALVDRLDALGPDGPWPARGLMAARAWAALNVLAGVVAIIAFAAGNQYFPGNYSSDVFARVRANPALDALPEGCTATSNLPNALYPRIEAEWSPRRTGLESAEPVDDLRELLRRLDAGASVCLVWVDEQPRYGHLWNCEDLAEELRLVLLAHDGDVTVYRLAPKA